MTGDTTGGSEPIPAIISRRRVHQAVSWYKACRFRHRCQESDSPFVPRRLVFVGDTNFPPRVVEVQEGDQTKLEYAALSYCWGHDGGTFRTTMDNINKNKCGINPKELRQVGSPRSSMFYSYTLTHADNTGCNLCLSQAGPEVFVGGRA